MKTSDQFYTLIERIPDSMQNYSASLAEIKAARESFDKFAQTQLEILAQSMKVQGMILEAQLNANEIQKRIWQSITTPIAANVQNNVSAAQQENVAILQTTLN